MFRRDSMIFVRTSRIFHLDARISRCAASIFGRVTSMFDRGTSIFGREPSIVRPESRISRRDVSIFLRIKSVPRRNSRIFAHELSDPGCQSSIAEHFRGKSRARTPSARVRSIIQQQLLGMPRCVMATMRHASVCLVETTFVGSWHVGISLCVLCALCGFNKASVPVV